MQILSGYSVCKMTTEYAAQFPNVDRISAMQIRGRKFCLRLLYIYMLMHVCALLTCLLAKRASSTSIEYFLFYLHL